MEISSIEYTQGWNTGQLRVFRGSFMVGILDKFDFGRFHFWLEYWTTLGSGCRFWLEYWTTLVLAVFTFGWNTGQLWNFLLSAPALLFFEAFFRKLSNILTKSDNKNIKLFSNPS